MPSERKVLQFSREELVLMSLILTAVDLGMTVSDTVDINDPINSATLMKCRIKIEKAAKKIVAEQGSRGPIPPGRGVVVSGSCHPSVLVPAFIKTFRDMLAEYPAHVRTFTAAIPENFILRIPRGAETDSHHEFWGTTTADNLLEDLVDVLDDIALKDLIPGRELGFGPLNVHRNVWGWGKKDTIVRIQELTAGEDL